MELNQFNHKNKILREQFVKIVEQTPGAISYLAFSYMDDSTVALSIDGVEPKRRTRERQFMEKSGLMNICIQKGEPNKEVKSLLRLYGHR